MGMQMINHKYADQTMKLVFIPTEHADKTHMEEVMSTGKSLMSGTCTTKEAGATIAPSASGSCFDLHVGSLWESTWTIATSDFSALVILAQHVPTEFEYNKHYLKDSAGTDIEPAAQENLAGGHDGHDHGGGAETDSHDGHDHGGSAETDSHDGHDHGDSHDGHDHGGGSTAFEWSGIFKVDGGSYTWIMQKVGGKYADATMELVLIPANPNP